jgi:hypothetical protein
VRQEKKSQTEKEKKKRPKGYIYRREKMQAKEGKN